MRQLCRVSLRRHLDALAVDDEVVPVRIDRARIRSMHRIALEQQCVGFRIGEIVDRDQFKAAIRPFEDRPGYEAANPPEAVDRNFHCHSRFSLPSSKSCRSEEHTSELQSLMRISYAVF